jgi:hypothetical protein
MVSYLPKTWVNGCKAAKMGAKIQRYRMAPPTIAVPIPKMVFMSCLHREKDFYLRGMGALPEDAA